MLGVAAGFSSCGQFDCNLYPVGGAGRGSIGYRLGVIAPVLAVAGGGARIGADEARAVFESEGEAGGSFTFFDIGAGLDVFPIAKGRVDPFLSAALGYSRVELKLNLRDDEFRVTYSRGMVRLGAGLNLFISRRVSVGPRFDAIFTFAGQMCSELNGNTVQTASDRCQSTRDVVRQGEDAVAERGLRRAFPRPWIVAAQRSSGVLLRVSQAHGE